MMPAARPFVSFVAWMLFSALPLSAQIPADDTAAATRALEAARDSVRDATTGPLSARAQRMIVLGLWDEAQQSLASAPASPDRDAALALLAFRRHRYEDAQTAVDRALAADPAHRDALLMRARLEIQAWRLDDAVRTLESLLRRIERDEAAALLIGRIRLLEKDYETALEWALRVQGWNERNAGAFLLEADTRFWDQDPAGAEPALVRSLELDPFDPDARFAYGYAIWRRVDATLLDAMAAQWDLALAVDPLHYVTHWHWGNGHTNLTYADYAHPTDSIVRERLKRPDSLISAGRIADAVAETRAVEREYAKSVLPAMMRASTWYMADGPGLAERMDSAQATFESILHRKPHYGPAHNGLAAVIKKRQFQVLSDYDEREAAIAATALPDDALFFDVFSDARYYPGERVLKMIVEQLVSTTAYVPMLHRQGRRFTIPPLHRDLAEAQNRPSFRYTTTFDNRQWMDIRGVGGGSTGIEYVERGGHWERNVLLHEYAHLFHGNVLTDAENRRIRALYFAAMEAGRTLDYYASNNESEFFAQAWEAYSMPKKVHPLNHKSMNSIDDLRAKDPELYAFIDSMATRATSFLAGDTLALRSNWAETYVNLSRAAGGGGGGGGGGGRPGGADRAAGDRLPEVLALLDTALIWDGEYLPAMVRYSAVLAGAGRFDEAQQWLERAEDLDPYWAPVQVAHADLIAARTAAGELDAVRALELRIAHYQRALQVEDDLAERASLNARLRNDLAAHGLVPEAIGVAEEYAAQGPTISTYLRDRRDEARAFALEQRAAAGHAAATLDAFAELVAARPFNYGLRAQYADALAAAGRHSEASAVLEESQRILESAGEPRVDYAIRIAAYQLADGRTDAARSTVDFVLRRPRLAADARLARVLAGLRDPARARTVLPDSGETPATRAARSHALAAILLAEGDAAGAERALRETIGELPYHVEARLELLALLIETGRAGEARAVADSSPPGMLRLGPDYQRRAGALLRGDSR
jgi:tetratricopeptide (TPR) repeat protein